MKALVTGGLGFIGAQMCQKLLNMDMDVVVIDVGIPGLKRLIKHDRIEYHFCDVADYRATRDLYDDVDYVFHMAAVSRVPACEDNPTIAFATNYLGTATMLQCSLEAGVRHVVNSSTSAVYGNTSSNTDPYLQRLSDKPNPISHYGLSKLHAEQLCNYYYEKKGLNVTNLRYFNVYGPGEDADGQYAQVIAIFLNRIKQGEPIKIFGDGTQTRDFVHVEDIVDVNIRAAAYKAADGRTFNVGTGYSHSVKDIADELTHDDSNILYAEKREGDPDHTRADIEQLIRYLEYIPQNRVISYLKDKLHEV